jgi:DNA-directed RNA polymerase specialized sigma24 family protein
VKRIRPAPLSKQQQDWILAARPGAARAALRLAGQNRLGLTRDEIRALAEDGLLAAARTFDPAEGTAFDVFSHRHVRGKVLNALEARRRALGDVPLGGDAGRAATRALLDDLGAGVDADAYDAWEDTDAVFLERAEDAADDAMLILVLGRIGREAGGAERTLLKGELRAEVAAEVAGLAPADARLVRMRFDEGMTFARIAELTGTPVSTLHLHLSRILCGLRQRLKQGR